MGYRYSYQEFFDMASTLLSLYPEDPTGTLASNKITNESHPLPPVATTTTKYRLILPNLAPFFVDSLTGITLTDANGNVTTLTVGKDIYPSYVFLSASRACAKPIAAGLTVLNNNLAGTINIASYQTLGGDWVADPNTLLELVANLAVNPITVSWEQITGLPNVFPPVAHVFDVEDLVGIDDLISSVDGITNALLQSGQQGLAQHEADHNNPHVTTAAQVGAYTTSQTDQAIAATAATLNQSISGVQGNLTAHITDTTNPHQTTATQVGLGLVQNFPIATDAVAVAGTSTTSYMTPRGVLLAMNAGPSSALNIHILDQTNPHKTTASQVGLGNVQNYSVASNTDALAGVATNLYITPAGLSYTITRGVQLNLTNHISNTSNPHSVTAAQVGLGSVQNYGIATQGDAIAGTSNTLYMTPLMTAIAVANIPSQALANHINDQTNPHKVTAAQVGTYTTAQIDSMVSGKLGVTAQAADSALFGGQTPSAFATNVLTGTAANATAFGGQTPTAFTASVLQGTAANANMIGGQNLAALDVRYAKPGNTVTQNTLSNIVSGTGTATNIWTSIGSITLPTDLTVVANQLTDLQWYVTGGDAQNATKSSMYYVRMATRGGSISTFNMGSKSMGDYDTGATFGYTVASGVLTIWMKSVDSLSGLSITDLRPGIGVINTTPTIVTTAPTGIVYANA